jgi:hypothetical protein
VPEFWNATKADWRGDLSDFSGNAQSWACADFNEYQVELTI